MQVAPSRRQSAQKRSATCKSVLAEDSCSCSRTETPAMPQGSTKLRSGRGGGRAEDRDSRAWRAADQLSHGGPAITARTLPARRSSRHRKTTRLSVRSPCCWECTTSTDRT